MTSLRVRVEVSAIRGENATTLKRLETFGGGIVNFSPIWVRRHVELVR